VASVDDLTRLIDEVIGTAGQLAEPPRVPPKENLLNGQSTSAFCGPGCGRHTQRTSSIIQRSVTCNLFHSSAVISLSEMP
jgi:hypothetical protein